MCKFKREHVAVINEINTYWLQNDRYLDFQTRTEVEEIRRQEETERKREEDRIATLAADLRRREDAIMAEEQRLEQEVEDYLREEDEAQYYQEYVW